MLGYRWRLILLLFAAIFFFSPVAESIHWGQIGIVLLTCWTAGIVLYSKGHLRTSALLLALATSIKLTPLLAVFPMLLWGEWKWLRWYAAGTAACLAIVLASNGTASLAAYFLHVLPAMATGVANFQNKSVSSALQLATLARHGGDVLGAGSLLWDNDSAPPRAIAPGWVFLLAKAICAAATLFVMWLVWRLGRGIRVAQRIWVLAAVATLSISLSPVAWRHSYCMAVPLLVLVWHDAWQRAVPAFELLLIGLFSIEVSSFFFEALAAHTVHGVFLGATVAALPVFSVALVIYQLLSMHPQRGLIMPAATGSSTTAYMSA